MKLNFSICLFLILMLIPVKSFSGLGDVVPITTTASGVLEIAEEEAIEEQEVIEEEEEAVAINQTEVASISSSAGLSEPSVISTSLADDFVEAEVDLAATSTDTFTGGTQTGLTSSGGTTTSQTNTDLVPVQSQTTVQAAGQETTVGINQPSGQEGSSNNSGSTGTTTVSVPSTDTGSVTNGTSVEGNGGNLAGGTQTSLSTGNAGNLTSGNQTAVRDVSKTSPNRSDDASRKGGRKRTHFFNERSDDSKNQNDSLRQLQRREISG